MKAVRAVAYNTGIAAEYFVLSQLFRLGIEAYVSLGNKKAIDIRLVGLYAPSLIKTHWPILCAR